MHRYAKPVKITQGVNTWFSRYSDCQSHKISIEHAVIFSCPIVAGHDFMLSLLKADVDQTIAVSHVDIEESPGSIKQGAR